MENTKNKTGPKPKDAALRKVGTSFSVLPHHKAALENLARQKGWSMGELIVKKFNLK